VHKVQEYLRANLKMVEKPENGGNLKLVDISVLVSI
jgi:hypothetical protein